MRTLVTRPALHEEHLWLGPVGWIVVVAFAGGLGAALLPVSIGLAIGVAAAALTGGIVLAVVTAPRVAVVAGELTAGIAHIPVTLLGTVTVLDREALRRAMGPDLDARAYVCLRTWVGRGIRVEVADPADPTPYWIVSSRRPARLADAIGQERERPVARS